MGQNRLSKPHLPLEILQLIVEIVAWHESPGVLRTPVLCSCALVCHTFRHIAQKYLFQRAYLDFSSEDNARSLCLSWSQGARFFRLCRSSPWRIGNYVKKAIIKDIKSTRDWRTFLQIVNLATHLNSITLGGCDLSSIAMPLLPRISHLSIVSTRFATADVLREFICSLPSLVSLRLTDVATTDGTTPAFLPESPCLNLIHLTITLLSPSGAYGSILSMVNSEALQTLTVSSNLALSRQLHLPSSTHLTIEHQDGTHFDPSLASIFRHADRVEIHVRRDVDVLAEYMGVLSSATSDSNRADEACVALKELEINLLIWQESSAWQQVDEEVSKIDGFRRLRVSVAAAAKRELGSAENLRRAVERALPTLTYSKKLDVGLSC